MIRRSPPLMLLATVVTLWLGGRLLVAWPASPLTNGEEVIVETAMPPLEAIPVQLVSRPMDPSAAQGRWTLPRFDVPSAATRMAPVPFIPRLRLTPQSEPRSQPAPAQAPLDMAVSDRSTQSLMLALHLAPYRSAKGVALAGRPGQFGGLLPTWPTLRSPPPDVTRRWSGVAWLALRQGEGAGLTAASANGLLGGSQAGARLGLALNRSRRSEAYLRLVTTGRRMEGGEAAVGVDWQPLPSLPVRLAVERRQRMSGRDSRSAFAAMAVGGVSDMPLPHGWRLDGYGAAGVVGARRRDMFAEAAIHARRPLAQWGAVRVAGGAGIWGAAQSGVARLDAGPGLSLSFGQSLPTARLSLDWRQRLAGQAAPDSGVAVTLASDF